MSLKTKLFGTVYQFKDLKDLFAKANEEKSGDMLLGIGALTAQERMAAKIILSELSLEYIRNNPVIPPETDEVSRVIESLVNETIYSKIKSWSVGYLREYLLQHTTSKEDIISIRNGLTSEMIAGVTKLMSNMDLVYGAQKIRVAARCNTVVGKEGTLSFRLQANHPSDNIKGILASTMEGLSYGSGDACIGINPAGDSPENTRAIMEAINDFMLKWEIPTQTTVLSHITSQMKAVEQGAPVSMFFQSVAGTQLANDAFGVTEVMLDEGYDMIKRLGTAAGPNLMYFETGQGSEMSLNTDRGVDMLTLEARCYGYAKKWQPFLVNNVSGFIGPETLYDGKQILRASLEDHYMGKLTGLPMGMAPCYTNHTKIDQNDQESATMLLAMAGSNYYMGIPMGDDIMLNYQDTSCHDDATLREMLKLKPADEFFKWMKKMDLMDENGILTAKAGDASIFLP